MFPITVYIAARPAPYLTADYRPSFIFLLLFPSRCQYPLALCAQTANNKNESFECAMFGFATQASAVYIMYFTVYIMLVSVSLFKLQFLPGFWSWGSNFRWDLIQVLCIYLFIFTGGRVFHLLWHDSVSALLTFSWLCEAVCQHLADDLESFVAFLNIVTNVSAISGLFFFIQSLVCSVRNLWKLKWMASDNSSKQLRCCIPLSF